MNTLTTIENVRASGSSWVATLLGDKQAGTTDKDLGEKLVAIYERDPKNCLVEIGLEKRDGRLWITSVDFIEAPPELGGPPDKDAPPEEEQAEVDAVVTRAVVEKAEDEKSPAAFQIADMIESYDQDSTISLERLSTYLQALEYRLAVAELAIAEFDPGVPMEQA